VPWKKHVVLAKGTLTSHRVQGNRST